MMTATITGVVQTAGDKMHGSAAAFSPDVRLLATGSEDRTVLLWNLTGPPR